MAYSSNMPSGTVFLSPAAAKGGKTKLNISKLSPISRIIVFILFGLLDSEVSITDIIVQLKRSPCLRLTLRILGLGEKLPRNVFFKLLGGFVGHEFKQNTRTSNSFII